MGALLCPLCLLDLITLHPSRRSGFQCLVFMCPPRPVRGTRSHAPASEIGVPALEALYPAPVTVPQPQRWWLLPAEIVSVSFINISFIYLQFSSVTFSNSLYWVLCGNFCFPDWISIDT